MSGSISPDLGLYQVFFMDPQHWLLGGRSYESKTGISGFLASEGGRHKNFLLCGAITTQWTCARNFLYFHSTVKSRNKHRSCVG
jgi:hypothetical protein